MNRRLRSACGVAALCVAASAALLAGGRIGSTWALFSAETTNAGSAFAAGWVAPATSATASPSGADVSLAWTPGAQGVASQQLYWADNGTSSSCGSPTWATLGGSLAAATGTATDSGRGSSANGHYVCYRVDGVNGPWTRTTVFPAVRVGFVATSAALGNGNNTLDTGDTFSVTFNQPPATPSATKLCTFASVVLVGDVPGTCASSSESAVLRFSLSSGSLSSPSTAYAVSWSVMGDTLTATVASVPNGKGNKTSASSPSWTFSPAGVSSATGSVGACTDSSCIPTPSGSF